MTQQQLIFDKYLIVRRLAIGGMGEIFLARQSGVLDRWVILKSMLPSLATDAAAVTMFLDEARLAATLNHPNIIAIYEVGRWEGSYFIAMEYLPGENLAVLSRSARMAGLQLPLVLVARIIHDAALGLDHAHHSRDAKGKPLQIIHRDVSPHNIMVTLEGMTKVVDFGIAKAVERDARTQTQLVRGKLRYMPPEQLLRDPVDGRSDQFALGIVFWELCTGQQLFGDLSTDMEAAMAIASKPIPKPSSIRKDIPKELEQVVMRMLQRTPSARFPRCLEVAKQLGTWLGEYLGAPGTQAVGELVERSLGGPIRERTSEVQAPTKPTEDNFLISFEGAKSPPANAKKKKNKSWSLAVGAGVFVSILALAAFAGAFAFRGEEQLAPVEVKKKTTAPETPPPPPPSRVITRLAVRSSPSGARVYDGVQPIGETPFEVELEPGIEHVLTIKKVGFSNYQTTVIVGKGEAKSLEVALAPAIAVAPEPTKKKSDGKRPQPQKEIPDAGVVPVVVKEGPGYLSVDSEPWSQVTVDGKYRGLTPLFKLELEPGKHIVQMHNEAAKIDVQREVTIRSGEITKVRP